MDLKQILYIVPVVLLSLSVHEFAHGYVSWKFGDPTAMKAGRLTLNPIKHLDPVGTIMMLISAYTGTGVGWAKPVPINPYYYWNWKKGMRYTSLAGPVSNFLLALIGGILLTVISPFYYSADNESIQRLLEIFVQFSFLIIQVNISMGVFNLLPIPPLDGSKIFGSFLPSRIYNQILNNEHLIGYGFLALIIMFPQALNRVLYPLIDGAVWLFGIILTPLEMLIENLFL